MDGAVPKASDFLRSWRQRRRLSQLDCALEANISQRHLSFMESGRAAPSRDMLLHLAECLDIPLRERNAALLAAGFAPVYPERRLEDPAMGGAREAIDRLLRGHEPFPALAIDRHWNLVAANAAVAPLLTDVEDQQLLAAPINVLRLSLHPGGLAPRIVNLGEWRGYLLDRLRRQIATTQDAVLIRLLAELMDYPTATPHQDAPPEPAAVLVPMRLKTPHGELSLISTTTVFGTPRDILLSEMAIEAFFPADAATRVILETTLRHAGAVD